jgi:multidrug efflux pump subunit AcrA (membrane-fusion protein)
MTIDSKFPNKGTATATVNSSNGYKLPARQETQAKIQTFRISVSAVFLGVALMTAGCGNLPKEAADAQSQSQKAGTRGGSTSIEVAIARNGKLQEEPEYTGTTCPLQEVSLRAQVEGRVLALNVDVGDTVRKGQAIARIDDALLRTALNADVAELARLRAEVARAQNQVSNAKAQVEQARLELGQSQSDSQRQQRLFREGAIAGTNGRTNPHNCSYSCTGTAGGD